jgi:hypothetical protein
MEISNARLKELVVDLLMSITDNCYEHSEKLNVIKGSCITADELKELGFDYVNDWLEDADTDDWEDEDDDEYIPSSTNGDYSPSNPWDAPGMSVSDFI